MGKDAAGSHYYTHEFWERVLESIPASYTVWYNSSDSKYYAECNLKGGTDYDDADVATVIQAAHDALSSGGTIFVKRDVGSAVLDSTVTLSNNNIRVFGEHTVLDVQTNGPAFDFTAKDCWLVGMYLDATNQVAGRTVNINTSDSYRNKILDCTIINNSNGTGVYLASGTYGNRVYRCNIGANNVGVDINSSGTNTLLNNFIESNTTYGVHIQGTTGDNKVLFNFLESNNDGVICAYNYNLIMGNEMNGEGRYGISNSGDYNRIKSNTFYNGTDYAIVSSGDNNVIVGNVLNQTKTASISGSGNIVKDNFGFVTENSGITSAIATGATVTHGLDGTPTSVRVTAAESGPTDIYVSSVGASTFAINFGGGGSKTFYWYAEYIP